MMATNNGNRVAAFVGTVVLMVSLGGYASAGQAVGNPFAMTSAPIELQWADGNMGEWERKIERNRLKKKAAAGEHCADSGKTEKKMVVMSSIEVACTVPKTSTEDARHA